MLRLKVMMEPGAGYVPRYAHEGDAGMDLRAVEDCVILPGGSAMVRTGVHVEIPSWHVGLLFLRSGFGGHEITIRDSVGVMGPGYRGEVRCALWNLAGEPFAVRAGDRVFQLVVMPKDRCKWEYGRRGTDGHGSTGVE